MRSFPLAAALIATLSFAAPAHAQTKKSPPKTPAAASPARTPAASPTATRAMTTTGPTMDNQISVWGILGYGYSAGSGFGLGARYQKVVVPEGFLHLTNGVRDELGVEGGIDYLHYSWDIVGFGWTYNEFTVVAGAAWNFWLNDKIAVYPKLDFGYRFGSWSSDFTGSNPRGYGGFLFQGAAGAVYKMDRLLLRAELGSATLRLGAAFTF